MHAGTNPPQVLANSRSRQLYDLSRERDSPSVLRAAAASGVPGAASAAYDEVEVRRGGQASTRRLTWVPASLPKFIATNAWHACEGFGFTTWQRWEYKVQMCSPNPLLPSVGGGAGYSVMAPAPFAFPPSPYAPAFLPGRWTCPGAWAVCSLAWTPALQERWTKCGRS